MIQKLFGTSLQILWNVWSEEARGNPMRLYEGKTEFTLLMSIIRWTACVGLFPFDRKIGRKYSRYLSTLRKAKGSKFINNFPRFSSTSSYWEDSCSCQTSWLEAPLLSLEAVEFHLVRKVLNIHKFIKFVHYISRRRNGIKDFPLRSTPGKL